MKYASDFRRIARDALRGNWGVAILTGFVASLIGATITPNGSSSGGNSSSGDTTNEFFSSDFFVEYIHIILLFLALVAILVITIAIISGAGKLGYAKFNLNLIDGKPASFSDLFSQFNRLGDGFCMNILLFLFTLLWTLLFIIPGIIKGYSYSMTPYIYSEHPEMTVNEAITESRRIMHGNKFRLFCLEFSFIGWELLSMVPVFVLLPILIADTWASFLLWFSASCVFILVAQLFLIPYQEAARAAFYREVSNTGIPDQDSDTL